MSVDNTIPRLTRLSSILTLLQSKKILTSGEIAEKFGISKRTAYRDIKALEASGIPIYTEEGKGYSLVEGYTLSPVMFTEEEANALITAQNIIAKNKDQSLVENHRNAITKVRAVLRKSGKDKSELLSKRVIYIKNFTKETTSNSLSSIQLAITNLSCIKIKYHSIGKNEVTYRVLEPQALYHIGDNWIMIAWCNLRNAYREFRLDKIQTLEMLSEKYLSRDFEIMQYFSSVYDRNKNHQ